MQLKIERFLKHNDHIHYVKAVQPKIVANMRFRRNTPRIQFKFFDKCVIYYFRNSFIIHMVIIYKIYQKLLYNYNHQEQSCS